MATSNFFKGGNGVLLEPVEQTAENPSSTTNFNEGTIIWNRVAESWYKLVSGSWVVATFSGSNPPLDGLSDVNTTGVSDGQVLSYDAATSTWGFTTVGSSGSGASTLNDLSDVTIASPQDENVLYYDASTTTWRRESFSGLTKFKTAVIDAYVKQNVSTKTADYTFSASEAGYTIFVDSNSSTSVTLPGSSSSFEVGNFGKFVQAGSGAVNFAGASGVTVNSYGGRTRLDGQWQTVDALYQSADTWFLLGDLAAGTSPSILDGEASSTSSLATYPKTGSVTTGDIWVNPDAASNGTGTEGSPYDNLTDAFAAVSDGERIIVRAGTISLSGNISRSTSWALGIEVFAYGDERVTLDCSALSSGTRAISFSGGNEHWKGFNFVDGPSSAMLITGSNYMIEDCWAHRMGSGGGGGIFYIFGDTNTGNIIQDCAAWRNGDGVSTSTNTPDNFKVHASYGTSTEYASGHAIVRCFAAHGPDDNYDLFYGVSNSILDCVAYRAGYYWNGAEAADGSGFKLGSGNTNIGNNTAQGCIAIANKNVGVNDNFSPEPSTVTNCTVVNDEWRPVRAGAAGSSVTNCIAFGNAAAEDVVGDTYNTWNSSGDAGGNTDFPISDPVFSSVAEFDYSLSPSSPCIGAGSSGGNLGASKLALEIAKEWLAKDLTT